MSKFDKLVLVFLSEPSDLVFADVRKLLVNFGFHEDSVSGSHHIFRHEDGRMISIPVKGGQKVKKIYIKKINELLNLEEWYEQQDR
ncbi:MAG TPA: type II toxin-antitoxin system HicA family toxin [Stenomitos sp.]